MRRRRFERLHNGITPTSPSQPQSYREPVDVDKHDASSEDWATIGVKVLSIALVPHGAALNVTVYMAPTPGAHQDSRAVLDQIADFLGNTSVPVVTYTGAVLTVSGNASDILLTAAGGSGAGFCCRCGHHDSGTVKFRFSIQKARAPISRYL